MSAHAATLGDGHAARAEQHVSAYHKSLLRSPVFLGMVIFLGSEIMLFGSFFTAFFYIRFTHHPWPPPGIEVPAASTAINTAILITSSFTMHWALISASRGKRFGLVFGLFLTLFLGLTFLSLQIHEYINLNFTPSTDAFGSGFFALTGLHGFHVFLGCTLLTIAFVRSCRGHYSPDDHIGLEVTGLYWHFVDVVWILLYTVVYLL
ncbi:MAG TPA: cytochrome c oxidase subunit 3 [Gaiellales bacterium]|nr:cytochrome c oxidase subunit 3 [Gaiellales bacterium]